MYSVMRKHPHRHPLIDHPHVQSKSPLSSNSPPPIFIDSSLPPPSRNKKDSPHGYLESTAFPQRAIKGKSKAAEIASRQTIPERPPQALTSLDEEWKKKKA